MQVVAREFYGAQIEPLNGQMQVVAREFYGAQIEPLNGQMQVVAREFYSGRYSVENYRARCFPQGGTRVPLFDAARPSRGLRDPTLPGPGPPAARRERGCIGPPGVDVGGAMY